jgi:RNA polymerase sigma factor (sigma-70 family)
MSFQETQAKIGEFFQTERQNLLRYLRGRLYELDQMELEDAISEVMLKLLSKADLAAAADNLAAYIYRALRNQVFDNLRKKQRTVSLDGPVFNSQRSLAEQLADPSPDLVEAVVNQVQRQRIMDALDGLEPKQRAVWVATELEDYTFRELSELWGEPLGTLLARKHRATAALQKALADLQQ